METPKQQPRVRGHVYCPCTRGLISLNSVKFLDIEENAQGEDVVKYDCPHCQRTHKGVVYG